MNGDPNEVTREEVELETEAGETELVEVGAVSGTQGSVHGVKPDTGIGVTFS